MSWRASSLGLLPVAPPVDPYQGAAAAAASVLPPESLILFEGTTSNMPRGELAAPIPIIAVVDDDPAVCNSLKFSLELEGFVVHAYRSGAEFLAAGAFRDCKCFIIDQRMPGMSGMEVIAALRQRKVSTPAILIISQPNRVLSARAAEAHVPIVEKPLLNNALVEKIREVCATV